MKQNLLFPSYFRYIGWVLAVPGLVLGYFFEFENFTFKFLGDGRQSLFFGNGNYTDELAITLITIGLFLVCFSANKSEDERSQSIFRKALYRSVFVATVLTLFLFIVSLVPVAPKGLFILILYFFLYQPIIFVAFFNYFLYFKHNPLKDTPPLQHKYFHVLGLFILAVCVLIRIIYACINFVNEDFLVAVYYAAAVGLLLLVFSKERIENAIVNEHRSGAMQLAVYIASIIFLIATWVVYGIDYLSYMYFYPLYLLGIYAVIFQYKLYNDRKQTQDIIALT